MVVDTIPERDHVLLVGKYGSGKSCYASQMSPEYLVLDFDGRWGEQKKNVRGKYHLVATNDVIEAVEDMRKRRKQLMGKIGTVIVDSGTTVLDTEQALGRLKVLRGEANPNDVNR